MSRKTVWLGSLCLAAILSLTACGTGEGQQSTPKQEYDFMGFTVEQTATGELGTYYIFETPEVTYGEKTAAVTVTVKSGDKTIPHDNRKVYLDSVQSYVVTYTATCDGDSESKTTTVSVADTTAPVFSSRLEGAVRIGTSVKLSDCFTVRDSSVLTSVTYTATREDGTPLPDGSFNQAENTLCVTDESIHRVKVSVSAVDEYDNEGSADFILPFSVTPTFGAFDFSWYENGEQNVGGVSAKTGAQITQPLTVVEEDGEKYVSVSFTTTEKNQYVYVQLDKELIGDFSSFDGVDVEMMLDYGGEGANGGNASLSGSEFGSAPVNSPQNVFHANKGKWFTYRYQGEKAQQSIVDNQGVYLLFKPWAQQNITIKIKSVTGVYNLPSQAGATFNLLEELSLEENELKNVAFNGVAVDNLTAFTPTGSGELTFEVEKVGHKKGTVSVSYFNPLSYGEVFDFSYPNLTDVSAGSVAAGATDAKSTMKTGEDANGKYVEIITENSQWINIRFFGADSADTLKNFDWFSVTFAAYYLDAQGEKHYANIYAYLQSNSENVATKALTLSGNETIQTYTADRATSSNFETALTDPFRMVFQNFGGYLDSTATDKVFKTVVIRVYGVEFGYSDLSLTDDTPSVDLTERFGLTAQELTNVNLNGVPVADITAFATTEGGTLTFDVIKEGYAKATFSVNVTYTASADYTLFNFDHPNLDNVYIQSTTSATANAEYKSVGEDADGKYLEVRATADWRNVYFANSPITAEDMKKYDWVKITFKGYYETSAGVMDTTKNFRISIGNKKDTGDIPANNQIRTFILNRADYADFDAAVTDAAGGSKMLRILFRHWGTGANLIQVVRFYDIEFGYNDIKTDGSAINLTDKFGAETEITATFTPTGGTETEISDVTAFVATESGTLKVTVKKFGYKAVTYTIQVIKE